MQLLSVVWIWGVRIISSLPLPKLLCILIGMEFTILAAALQDEPFTHRLILQRSQCLKRRPFITLIIVDFFEFTQDFLEFFFGVIQLWKSLFFYVYILFSEAGVVMLFFLIRLRQEGLVSAGIHIINGQQRKPCLGFTMVRGAKHYYQYKLLREEKDGKVINSSTTHWSHCLPTCWIDWFGIWLSRL